MAKKKSLLDKAKEINNFPYILASSAYLVSVIIVSPWYDIAINDDWDFALHVKYFSDGYWMKNQLIDSAFVLQGLISLLWTKLFGLNFISLRILTIIFTLLFLGGSYKILKHFKLRKLLITVVLLLLAFNPLIYLSSLSFMTEIYFLAFMVWSMYFFVKYLDNYTLKNLVIAAVLGGLSILIRQYGLVLFIAYSLVLLYDYFRTRKVQKVHIVYTFVIFLTLALVSFLWPKYSDENLTTIQTIQKLIVQPDKLLFQISNSVWFLTYLGFFLLPVTLNYLWVNKNRYLLGFSAVVTLVLYKTIYNKDIFPLGNTFYIEKLYAKTDFVHQINLFDNIPFKFGLSILIALSISVMVYVTGKKLVELYKTKDKNLAKIESQKLLFILITLGMFAIVILSNGYFDRYFVNMFVSLLLGLAVYGLKDIRINKWITGTFVVLIATVVIFLSIDYFNVQGIKWEQAKKVQEDKKIWTNVYVDGTFARYMHTIRYDNPTEVTSSLPMGLNFKCFSQVYYEGGNNIIMAFLNRTENSRTLNKYFINPEIYENKETPRIRDINKNMDKIMYSQEVFSPMYNLLGQKVFVGSYCHDKTK